MTISKGETKREVASSATNPCLYVYGELLKWLKRTVLKAVRRVITCMGSNPILSFNRFIIRSDCVER